MTIPELLAHADALDLRPPLSVSTRLVPIGRRTWEQPCTGLIVRGSANGYRIFNAAGTCLARRDLLGRARLFCTTQPRRT